jgi:hypothetical protein
MLQNYLRELFLWLTTMSQTAKLFISDPAMIGAGVYLVFIIVFFSIAIAIFYYFISY